MANNEAPTHWQPGDEWVSAYLPEHPLVGRVWSVDEQKFVDPKVLAKTLSGAAFVLLGEKHDNADHHQIQAWLTGQLLSGGRKMAVAFEMFGVDKAKVLRDFHETGSKEAADIAALTEWEKSGWPSWSLYQPIAQGALDAGMPILAANLSRQQTKTMMQQGNAVLGEQTVKRLRLDEPLPERVAVAKAEELIRSHCNMLPDPMVRPMVNTQTAKDAMMADVLLDADLSNKLEGVILITGLGHARSDWGVPWHLMRRAAEKSVISVGMLEVDVDLTKPSQYAGNWDVSKLPFDFVWFTPRANEDDPCDKYAEQLKKIGKSHKAP